MALNNVVLTGRTCSDIEVKVSNSGTHYCQFSLAVDDGFGEKKTTDFFNISAFGKIADNLAAYVKKGSIIGIKGALKTSSYTNKEGKKISTVTVRANEVSFESLKRDKKETPVAEPVMQETASPTVTAGMPF